MSRADNKRRRISKTALGDQHGFFQHFQSNTTDYATRDRYLALRGGEASIGRDTESLYGVSPEGDDSRVPTEYVAPHLSTRYSPDRVGIQAMRVSDGVYKDPYTNKVYDYNEGFKTEDGRNFPGGSASLQSSLMRVANTLDAVGFVKEASKVDSVMQIVAKIIAKDPTKASPLASVSPGTASSNLLSRDDVLKVLASAANRLDDSGLEMQAEQIDLIAEDIDSSEPQSSAESEAQAWDNLAEDDIRSIASALDRRGNHEVADILDSWMSKRSR